MMRMETKIYITALINTYEIEINKVRTETQVTRTLKNVVANLGSLTDFVMDLREDVQANDSDKISQVLETCFNLKHENDELLKRVENLSGSYQYANEQKEKAIDEVMNLRKDRDADYKTIEDNNHQINKLGCNDELLQSQVDYLKAKVKKLTGPQWLLND